MESCPFCRADVDEELILYGGNCPSCLNEIPGEEAPTDPGAQAKANAEIEAEAVKKRSRAPMIIGGLLAVLVAVGGGIYATQQPEPEAPMEMPEIVIDRDISGHINPDEPEGEDPPEELASASPGAAPRNDAPPTGGQVVASPQAPPDRGSIAPSGPKGGINSFDPGVALNPLGSVSASSKILTSESEINAMVASTLGTYTSRLQRCYNSRLKDREDLSGTWNIAFTITRQGKASRVSVSPRGASDAPLEACLQKTVTAFTFQKIAQEKPVSFPASFGT